MTTDLVDKRLIRAIADGLPLEPRPYAAVAAGLGLSEDAVIQRLKQLIDGGVIKRLGVVVHHHELGYRANAMAVWDVPDDAVADLGPRIASLPFVTLCYRRPRRPPAWPYNLFCMIHGKDRGQVERQIAAINRDVGLGAYPGAVLFSRRRFKQRGAQYGAETASQEVA